MSVLKAVALMGSLASTVSAHGYVSGIVAAGVYYAGYDPSFQYLSTEPKVIGWQDPEDLSNGYVVGFNSADIICHINATNANSHAPIAAGDEIEFQWTAWPSSHHGPVMTYLANCNGACETVDKTTLEFFKIDAGGLINDTTVPGIWATDVLIANNNSYVVNIPSDIEAGNYVIRHEILALHSAETAGGAQFYPQCMNLVISGDGTAKPSGVLGEKLYSTSEAGVLIDIYTSLSTYDIPGPTLWSGATAVASQTEVAIKSIAYYGETGSASAAATTAVASSTSAAVTSAAATSTSAASKTTAAATTSAAAKTSAAAASSSSAAVSSTVTSAAAVASSSSKAAVSSVSVAASSASAVFSSLTAKLPSSVLASTISTAIPAATATASSNTTVPTKPLPSGLTLMELIDWVELLIADYFTEEQHEAGKADDRVRSHPRDIKAYFA